MTELLTNFVLYNNWKYSIPTHVDRQNFGLFLDLIETNDTKQRIATPVLMAVTLYIFEKCTLKNSLYSGTNSDAVSLLKISFLFIKWQTNDMVLAWMLHF